MQDTSGAYVCQWYCLASQREAELLVPSREHPSAEMAFEADAGGDTNRYVEAGAAMHSNHVALLATLFGRIDKNADWC